MATRAPVPRTVHGKITMTDTLAADLIRFAKSRAKRLRAYLTQQNIALTHSACLEAIAKAEGFRDWNTYVASFKLAEMAIQSSAEEPDTFFPLQVGEIVSGQYRGAAFTGRLMGLENTINPNVWRAKLHFDEAVTIPGTELLKHTRQRVRCMLDAEGMSVNLKGRPDGQLLLKIKSGT